MSEKPFALLTLSPSLPAEDDYDAICSAVMQTARGRWFLERFAERNRNSDTRLVLDAIARIEQAIRGGQTQQAYQSFRNDLLQMARTIAVTRAEMGAVAPKAAPPGRRDTPRGEAESGSGRSALSDVLGAAERIQDPVWTMRDVGIDPRTCEQLEALATSIQSAAALRDPTAERAQRLTELLQYLERRLDAMIETAHPPAAGVAAASHEARVPDEEVDAPPPVSGAGLPEPQPDAQVATPDDVIAAMTGLALEPPAVPPTDGNPVDSAMDTATELSPGAAVTGGWEHYARAFEQPAPNVAAQAVELVPDAENSVPPPEIPVAAAATMATAEAQADFARPDPENISEAAAATADDALVETPTKFHEGPHPQRAIDADLSDISQVDKAKPDTLAAAGGDTLAMMEKTAPSAIVDGPAPAASPVERPPEFEALSADEERSPVSSPQSVPDEAAAMPNRAAMFADDNAPPPTTTLDAPAPPPDSVAATPHVEAEVIPSMWVPQFAPPVAHQPGNASAQVDAEAQTSVTAGTEPEDFLLAPMSMPGKTPGARIAAAEPPHDMPDESTAAAAVAPESIAADDGSVDTEPQTVEPSVAQAAPAPLISRTPQQPPPHDPLAVLMAMSDEERIALFT